MRVEKLHGSSASAAASRVTCHAALPPSTQPDPSAPQTAGYSVSPRSAANRKLMLMNAPLGLSRYWTHISWSYPAVPGVVQTCTVPRNSA